MDIKKSIATETVIRVSDKVLQLEASFDEAFAHFKTMMSDEMNYT